jgi:zinc/manganese transport system substrate-binding protein
MSHLVKGGIMVATRSLFLSLFYLVLTLLLLTACGGAPAGGTVSSPVTSASAVINVVAAENFYGDIVQQLGGNRVNVTSILSDPNVDPHQYESSPKTAFTVSKAQLVIANGGGYDAWMDKLLSASPDSSRIVLKGYDIAPVKLPDNEHVWYRFENMQAIAQAITQQLKKLDSTDSALFERNLQTFNRSLQPLQQKISAIKTKFDGTPVALTETIYLYQTQPEGLNVLTPLEFEKAIAEGNDPPADTVVTANKQINQRQVKVFIYNEQTITTVTTNLANAAKKQNIPIVPVTETMPPDKTYQSWMMGQLMALQAALAGK